MTGAERLADFALAFQVEALPDHVAVAARLHLLDAIGVGIAASTGADQAGWTNAIEAGGQATTLAGGKAAPADAAMLNGMLIHSLEFDDTHVPSVVHGSAVAAPVALAAAEMVADSNGYDLSSAYVIAWEIAIRLGLAAPGAFQARGVQVTAIAGAIAAAAAAGRVAGLGRQQLVSAIGIAGSQASGFLAFLDDGSSVKALNPGWAARTGVTAAALAGAGMTGPRTILESRFGPFGAFGAPTDRIGDALGDLGEVWRLPEAAFKLYPCCHYIHPFLEAVSLLSAQGLSAQNLSHLTAYVPVPQAPLTAEPWERRQAPTSGYDAKWGLAYCMALFLTDGTVNVASFEVPPRERVVSLARRMAWAPMENSGFPDVFPASIEARTTHGQNLSAVVETVRGVPERPIAKAEILTKFRANAARRMHAEAAEALERAVLEVPGAPDLAAIRQTLSR